MRHVSRYLHAARRACQLRTDANTAAKVGRPDIAAQLRESARVYLQVARNCC